MTAFRDPTDARLHEAAANRRLTRTIALVAAVLGCSTAVQAAQVRDVTGKPTLAPSVAGGNTASLTTQLPAALGLDTETTFSVASTRPLPNDLGQTVRLNQIYRGVPVWGQQVVVQIAPDSSITNVMGTAVYDVGGQTPATSPALTADEALQIAKSKVLGRTLAPKPLTYDNVENGLVYYLEDAGALRLSYRVSFYTDLTDAGGSATPTRPVYFIDAVTGDTVYSYDNIQYAKLGTGPGGNVKTAQYNYGSGNIPKFDLTQAGNACTMNGANVLSENLNHGTSGNQTPFAFTCFNNTYQTINGGYSPLNDAQSFGQVVYDMYSNWFQTAPVNIKLWMKVHYSNNYENAFWNGNSMTFGDGASTFYPLTGLDVTGHEISHGFTEQHSNLTYSGQSGGINEAFSDMAGETVEFYYTTAYGPLFPRTMPDYLVGAEIFKASGQALRYMCNPRQDGQSIDNVSQYYNGLDVHYSSGVYNKAFCLLAKTPGWNARTAFSVFEFANAHYWVPGTTFQTGAQAVYNASLALSLNYRDVAAAFGQVGITIAVPPNAVATHDFNGDGRSDIVWRYYQGGSAIWLMNGGSVIGSGGYQAIPLDYKIVGQRDFNGDGKADWLWRGSDGNTVMWLFNGTTVASATTIGVVPPAWFVAGTGDVNGDKKGDILWRDTSGNIAIWTMNGASVTSSALLGNLTTAWTIVGNADFDGDGKADILFRDTQGYVAIWFMNGTTVTSSVLLGQLSTAWTIVGTGDFNGDGKADILFRDTQGYIAIWLMNGSSVLGSTVLGPLTTAYTIVQTGDFNGDGKSDILFRDTLGGIAVWYMSGLTIAGSTTIGNPGLEWTMMGENND